MKRFLILKAPQADAGCFTDSELAIADTFKLERRREEWLLSRLAAKQLAMELGLADDPRAVTVERPFLIIDGVRTDWRVSLSHSAPYAGAAIARTPIGLDVQVVRELDERSAHLFLSPEETDQMSGCTLPHRILHFWCAKEAAWKQRSEEFVTLRQLPLALVEERADGLRFDVVETFALSDEWRRDAATAFRSAGVLAGWLGGVSPPWDLIAAITLPTP